MMTTLLGDKAQNVLLKMQKSVISSTISIARTHLKSPFKSRSEAGICFLWHAQQTLFSVFYIMNKY